MEAVVGLDDSAYRKAIQDVQSDTKKVVASLSSEYSKAAKSVAELTQKYNDSVSTTGKTSKETKGLKTQLAAAQAQLRATTSALKSANTNMAEFASSTQKASGESLTGALTKANLLTGALGKLGSAALSAAKSFVQSGIDYNAQIESYTVSFTNMLSNAEAAQQAMAAIQEDAAKTPFNVEALTQANQLLISAGENAGYSRKVIMALGNAVNAAGGGNAELERMSANLQQIANVGKASAIDIKQFAYAGINIYQVLADYTGKTVQEVQNMTISYDTLSQALIAASEEGGRYYGAMDTQSQTMNGRVSTLKDNVKQLAGLMTGDLSDGVGIVIGNMNDLTVAAQEAYKKDGWIGLVGAITGLSEPIDSAKTKFDEFASSAVTWLDQLSYKLNRFLGKAATADFDTYEEYAADQQKQRNRDRLRQNALNGIGISNKSWSERQAELAAANGDGNSSITGNNSGTTSKKSTGSKTETVIASVSSTVSTTAQNALGNVTTSITTLQEKVKDASGKIKDRVTTTTTETGKELVNGVETTYKTVETKVDGIVTKTVKTYDDMSKALTETATRTATKTVQGVTTAINEVTEKYADGSEHIKTTETRTEEVIVDGVAQTVKTITTYIDGIPDKVQTTTEEVERTVLASQNRIEQYQSELGQEMSKGIFGLTRSLVSNLQSKNWSGVAQNVAKLIFGQVDQKQRETITKWADDAAAAINERYAGGGIQAGLQAIADLFRNGITPAVNESTKEIQSFAAVMKGLSGSSGTGSVVNSLIKLFGGGSAGTAASGAAGEAAGNAIASAASGATSFFPEALALLAAIAGGVVSFKMGQSDRAKADAGEEKSLGSKILTFIGLAAAGPLGWLGYLLGRSKKSKVVSDSSSAAEETSQGLSYKDIQDAYWYGNERAFAGYDFRTDPYTYNPYNSIMNQYQDKMQAHLAKLTDVVEQYLPEVANTQLVLDDGTLVGAMAPGMNDQLGQLQMLAERGN